MTVREIYVQYMTPVSLQKHMLWTAALAQILLEDWHGVDLDKTAIVLACLFHDIAKPIHFDLAKQAQFGMSEEEIQRLGELQYRIKNTYGTEEHLATVQICRELGLHNKAIALVDDLEWKYIPRFISENKIASLVPIYCDMRIGPKGILPLRDRLREIENRVGGDDCEEHVRNGTILESKLIAYVGLDVTSITQDYLDARIDSLLHMEIGN